MEKHTSQNVWFKKPTAEWHKTSENIVRFFFSTHLNYSFAENVSNLEWIFMDKLYENGGFK